MSKRKSMLGKFRDLSPEDIRREEGELRGQIWKMQMQRSTGQAQDPHPLQRVRKDLARLLTVRREKETGQAGREKR